MALEAKLIVHIKGYSESESILIMTLGDRGFISEISGEAYKGGNTVWGQGNPKVHSVTGDYRGMPTQKIIEISGLPPSSICQSSTKLIKKRLVAKLNTYTSIQLYKEGNQRVAELVLTKEGTALYKEVKQILSNKGSESDYQI